MSDTKPDVFSLADRIHARAAFVAELLEFYPHAPTETDLMGMWVIMRDIAADAKLTMRLLSQVADRDQAGGVQGKPEH